MNEPTRTRVLPSRQSPVPIPTPTPTPPPTASSRVVPAYFGPWATDEWDALFALRPAIVVINPANGPGEKPHDGYREIVERCEEIGTEVLGYVATGWLQRGADDIADDAHSYRRWYGTSGTFFDEIPNRSARGGLGVLTRLDELMRPQRTVFNCGQPIPRRWYRLFPGVVWGTFEGGPAQLAESAFVGPPRRQIHLVHSVSAPTAAAVAAELTRRGVGFACITADELPNPWDVCPAE